MFEYCFSDVEILAQGCMKYRKLFIAISGEDPFQYITVAQLCTIIFRHMIPEETIGIMKTTSFEDIQSEKAIKWLEYVSQQNKITIQHARRGGEVRLNKWKFDGFCEKENRVYEILWMLFPWLSELLSK